MLVGQPVGVFPSVGSHHPGGGEEQLLSAPVLLEVLTSAHCPLLSIETLWPPIKFANPRSAMTSFNVCVDPLYNCTYYFVAT